jgi:hypothetical protein
VTVVSVTYIHRLTLNRSRTYASCCVADHVYVVNRCEKGNAHGLHLDMLELLDVDNICSHLTGYK